MADYSPDNAKIDARSASQKRSDPSELLRGKDLSREKGLSREKDLSRGNVPSREKAVGYMARTRQYYRALGYTKDYTWAHNTQIPFSQPSKPLSDMTVAVVTTSSPANTTKADAPAVWSAQAMPMPKAMYTDNLAWDKETTHTNDTGTFLPMNAMQTLVERGELGAIAPNIHGVPTEYSQRQTLDNDAPEILRRVRADKADAVILVPL